MEELAAKYPESAPHLESLPPHLVEELGEVAMSLTHEDMHPKVEVPDTYGGTRLEADFSQVIIDPEYDSDTLEVGAVEAAEAGQKKISELMLGSSKALEAAQHKLESDGFTFGSRELETDEERNTREKMERDTVYDAACTQAVESAKAAKEHGNNEQARASLEALLFIRSIRGGEEHKELRGAVKQGLSQELLSATQEMDKVINADVKYSKISSSMWQGRKLLEMTTGTRLGSHFEVVGEMTGLESSPIQPEALKDVVCAMSSPGSWLTPEKAFEFSRGSAVMGNIQAHYNPSAEAGSVGSTDYFSRLIEVEAESQKLNDALKCTDPLQAIEVAKQFDLNPGRILNLYGRAENYNDPIQIDSELVNQMADLKGKFPEVYEQLVDFASNLPRPTEYQPAEVTAALTRLSEAGIKNPEVTPWLVRSKDIALTAESCIALYDIGRERGIEPGELPGLLQTAGMPIREMLGSSEIDSAKMSEKLDRVVAKAEITEKYLKLYHNLEFPLDGRVEIKSLELKDMPHVLEKMLELGLPEDVAGEMFKSWATYDSLTKHYYDISDSFDFPDEVPTEGTLEAIAREQADALLSQMDALEKFEGEYGFETTKAVIETFGIYNFSRYNPNALKAQYDAWESGAPIRNIVVNSRADWNSYTAKSVKFEEVEGEGAFYFEANSGTETARIAVRIGQYERAHEREPNVERFIIHAHGNSTSMRMGVNGEAINTASYLEASQNASKIGASEINDYHRHLGENFEVVLQSCSTAGKVPFGKNIAETVSERHAVEVVASDVTISGLTIQKDGSVRFVTTTGDGMPVVYQN